jgi:hypothetical protein
MSSDAEDFVDANAAAGSLREIFAVDLTAATGRCDSCGNTAVLAQARLYTRAPGVVARCVQCDAVLFRLVQSPRRTWLDLRGLAYLEITVEVAAPAS